MRRHIPSLQSTAQPADDPYQDQRAGNAASRRAATLPRGVTILIAITLITFGAVHVLGGVMFHARAGATATSYHMVAAD